MSLGHKSNARKTPYKGRLYDSMLEASVARDLDTLLRSKRIKAVEPQVWFDLKGVNGTVVCRHRPDFLVTCNDGTQKILEAKGEKSADWIIKKKLFEDNYPHLEYIVATRENVNYGRIIDVPKATGPVPPNSYSADVEAVMKHLK